MKVILATFSIIMIQLRSISAWIDAGNAKNRYFYHYIHRSSSALPIVHCGKFFLRRSLVTKEKCAQITSFKSLPSTNLESQQTLKEIQMTKDIKEIVQHAIQSVDPAVAVKRSVRKFNYCDIDDGNSNNHSISSNNKEALYVGGDSSKHYDKHETPYASYVLENYESIVVVGIGKAASAMAAAVLEILMSSNPPNVETEKSTVMQSKITGLVITKTGHVTDEQRKYLESNNVNVREASHPIPCEVGVAASYELLDLVSYNEFNSKKSKLVIACISGGGSALFCTPIPPLTLNDLKATNTALLQTGWPISTINKIRTVLEKGKGGGLASAALLQSPSGAVSNTDIVSLILSDVVGDPLDIIASGPTVIQSEATRYKTIQEAYDLVHHRTPPHVQFPKAVKDFLVREYETTKKIDLVNDTNCTYFNRCFNHLVGNNAIAVEAAATKALSMGYHPIILGTQIQGEASTVAQVLVGMAQHIQQPTTIHTMNNPGTFPVALVAGGETTVTLPTEDTVHRLGGRNQELALAAALALKDSKLRQIVLASVGTDGNDGPTDAAGAIIDGRTVNQLDAITSSNNILPLDQNLSAKASLQYHNAYPYLNQTDVTTGDSPLLKTGPTGTNVADIIVLLIHNKS